MAATDLPGQPKKCRNPESEDRQQISAIDISRACFNASTDPDDPSYTELPEEDPDRERGMCGLLLKHMYGTRRAADGWQQEYSGYMKEIVFEQGVACLACFTIKCGIL